MRSLRLISIILGLALFPAKIGIAADTGTPRPPNLHQIEADIKAHNAALAVNGGRVSLLALHSGHDKNTVPDDVIDGNQRTRYLAWNPPYVLRVELVDKLPITQINFILDDYETEAWPQHLQITLSDGTVLTKTLQQLRPARNQPLPRQSLDVNKEIAWFEVKILDQVHGTDKDGKDINYGGIGEIEAITSADLTKYTTLPDSNPNSPTYIEAGSPASDYSNVKVTMPTVIPTGQHPCIYLSRDEIVQLRQTMAKTARGQKALAAVLDTTAPWVGRPIEMPDPKVPAQMTDRSDAPAKAHAALCQAAGRLGWAYQISDDEKYAAKAREILLGYAKLYVNDYAEHKGKANPNDTGKIMAQRLSEAMCLLMLEQSYDMIYNAKCMSDADRKQIETGLIRPALTFIHERPPETEVKLRDAKNPDWRNADPGPGKPVGNWVNFYNAAYIQGGLVMGDQNWVDIGAADTRVMIAHGIGDDGMWKEGAIGYQLFARLALVDCLEPLARHGIDLYSFEKCRVKNLWDSPYKYAYPDGTAPGINDSDRIKVAGDWAAEPYDFGWLRYHDPNYGMAVNQAPRQLIQSEAVCSPTVIYESLPEQPLQGVGSLVFGTLGYGIMRGTDAGSPTFLLLNCGMDAGPHDHPEKLDLLIYADGDELTGEPDFYRYEDDRHGDWTTATVAHFCVAVDQKSQMHTSGSRLIGFYDAGNVKIMRGVCDTAFPGVGLDRTVVQMPGYIADVYRVHSPNVHTYDYPLCFRGNLDALAAASASDLKPMSDSRQGYKCITAMEPVNRDTDWTGTWTRAAKAPVATTSPTSADNGNPANRVTVTVVGSPGSQIIPGRDVDGRDRVLIRRSGREAVFASVINPYKSLDVVKSVQTIQVNGPVGSYGLKITRTDGGTDLIIVRFDPQTNNALAAASSFEGGSTDALISVIRLDPSGKPITTGFVGGTSLTFAGTTLNRPNAGIKWDTQEHQ